MDKGRAVLKFLLAWSATNWAWGLPGFGGSAVLATLFGVLLNALGFVSWPVLILLSVGVFLFLLRPIALIAGSAERRLGWGRIPGVAPQPAKGFTMMLGVGGAEPVQVASFEEAIRLIEDGIAKGAGRGGDGGAGGKGGDVHGEGQAGSGGSGGDGGGGWAGGGRGGDGGAAFSRKAAGQVEFYATRSEMVAARGGLKKELDGVFVAWAAWYVGTHATLEDTFKTTHKPQKLILLNPMGKGAQNAMWLLDQPFEVFRQNVQVTIDKAREAKTEVYLLDAPMTLMVIAEPEARGGRGWVRIETAIPGSSVRPNYVIYEADRPELFNEFVEGFKAMINHVETVIVG